MVDDTVTEIMKAAKDDAAAAELSEAPDSKIEEEAEVPTEAASEADGKEADDGIHTFFFFISHIH